MSLSLIARVVWSNDQFVLIRHDHFEAEMSKCVDLERKRMRFRILKAEERLRRCGMGLATKD